MTSISVRFLAAAGLAMVPALSELPPELKIAPPTCISESQTEFISNNKNSLKIDLGHCEYLKTIRELRNCSKEYPSLDPAVNGILSPIEENVAKGENNNQGMCLKGNDSENVDVTMGHVDDSEMDIGEIPEIKGGLSEIVRILGDSSPNHVDDILDVIGNIDVDPSKFDPSSHDLLAVLDSLNTPPLSCEDGEVKGVIETAECKPELEEKPAVEVSEQNWEAKHANLLERQKRLAERFRNISVQESVKHISSEIGLFMHYTKNNFKLHEIREKILKSGSCQLGIANQSDAKTSASDKPNKHRYFGAGVCRTVADQKVEVKLNERIGRNIRDVSEKWLWNLKLLKSAEDPYATDSSSGGESDNDDEYFQEKGDKKDLDASFKDDNSRPLYERAVWRWARERSAIASRWTWLQAQVADLDGKIAHYADLEKKVRAGKQKLELVPAPCTDSDAPSSRTRALLNSAKSFQRRKLVQSSTKKGAKCVRCLNSGLKRSSVNCGCLLEKSACFLCGGENKSVKTVDVDARARQRIAEIDGAFHPVLSATNETPLSIHIDSLIQTGEWRTLLRSKPIPESLPKVHSDPDIVYSQAETSSGRCERRRHLQRISSLPQTPNEKGFKTRNHSESQESDNRDSPLPGHCRYEKSAQFETNRNRRKYDESDQERVDSPASPAPSTSSVETGYVTRRDRNYHSEAALKRRSTYDIDQILLPYSVAAATRVQILQYKEIQTPSWRECSSKPDPKIHPSELEENTRDVEYKLRHDRAELEERRKFYSKPGMPASFAFEKDQLKKARRTDSSDRFDGDESSSRQLTNGDQTENRRTSNSQLRLDEFSPSIDDERAVSSFPLRRFPLSDIAYQSMMKEMEVLIDDEGTRPKRPRLTAGQITDEWNSNGESDDDKWLG